MSETQFLPSNIIFQNALQNNIKVISRIGGTKKLVLDYTDLKMKLFNLIIKFLNFN